MFTTCFLFSRTKLHIIMRISKHICRYYAEIFRNCISPYILLMKFDGRVCYTLLYHHRN